MQEDVDAGQKIGRKPFIRGDNYEKAIDAEYEEVPQEK